MVNFKRLKFPKEYEFINNNLKFYKDIDEQIDNGEPMRLMFTGSVGSGKTMLMKIIADAIDKKDEEEYSRTYEERMQEYLSTGKDRPEYVPIERITMDDFYSDYFQVICSDCSDKSEAVIKRKARFLKKNIMIDDLGAEIELNKNARSLSVELLQRLYNRYKDGLVNHILITTNLTGGDMINHYGPRIYDRLKELCAGGIVVFPNDSFRGKDEKARKL